LGVNNAPTTATQSLPVGLFCCRRSGLHCRLVRPVGEGVGKRQRTLFRQFLCMLLALSLAVTVERETEPGTALSQLADASHETEDQ